MNKIINKPLISIIIPAKNEEKYIKKTLQSIKEQSYKNIEIIVICDNCRDKTQQIAKKYTAKVYDVKMSNVSIARNFGVKQAEGEILVFIDADCTMDHILVEKIVQCCKQGYIGGTTKTLPIEDKLNNKLKHKLLWGLGNISRHIFLTASGIIFCKAKYFAIFRHDLNIAEDTYFILALKKKGKLKYITSSFIKTSMRRFEKEGYIKTITKQVFAFLSQKKIKYKEIR